MFNIQWQWILLDSSSVIRPLRMHHHLKVGSVVAPKLKKGNCPSSGISIVLHWSVQLRIDPLIIIALFIKCSLRLSIHTHWFKSLDLTTLLTAHCRKKVGWYRYTTKPHALILSLFPLCFEFYYMDCGNRPRHGGVTQHLHLRRRLVRISGCVPVDVVPMTGISFPFFFFFFCENFGCRSSKRLCANGFFSFWLTFCATNGLSSLTMALPLSIRLSSLRWAGLFLAGACCQI